MSRRLVSHVPKPTPGLGLDTIILWYDENRDDEAEQALDSLEREEEGNTEYLDLDATSFARRTVFMLRNDTPRYEANGEACVNMIINLELTGMMTSAKARLRGPFSWRAGQNLNFS